VAEGKYLKIILNLIFGPKRYLVEMGPGNLVAESVDTDWVDDPEVSVS